MTPAALEDRTALKLESLQEQSNLGAHITKSSGCGCGCGSDASEQVVGACARMARAGSCLHLEDTCLKCKT